jgi:alpha-glucosidase (family GH31 glycosyl hydrolase)
LVREGALIPLGPIQQYVEQKPLEEVRWLVFSGSQPTSFTLYTDDGDGLEHRRGAYAACTLLCTPINGGFELSWSEIEGGEPERISRLQHRFEFLGERSPLRIEADDQELGIEQDEVRPTWVTDSVATGTKVRIINH